MSKNVDRIQRIFLCLMILLGQLHSCPITFLTSKGSVCYDCKSVSNPPSAALAQASAGTIAAQKDCRDCCFIDACDYEPSRTAEQAIPPAFIVAVMPEPPVCDVAIPRLVSHPEFHEARSELPPGPSDEHPSRAPPVA